jgi:hypothetical protein
MEKVGRDRSMGGIFPGDIHLIPFSTLPNGGGISNSPTRIYSTSKAREGGGMSIDPSVYPFHNLMYPSPFMSCGVFSNNWTDEQRQTFLFLPLTGHAYAHAF